MCRFTQIKGTGLTEFIIIMTSNTPSVTLSSFTILCSSLQSLYAFVTFLYTIEIRQHLVLCADFLDLSAINYHDAVCHINNFLLM